VIFLHIGGASAGTVLVSVIAIFFLIFAMSFAVGSIPEGHRRFTRKWFNAWFRASLPRIVIAGTFSALLFMGSALSGGSQSDASIAATCESPLAPNTGRIVSEIRLANAISGMRDIASAARQGDMQTAQELFFTNDSHNVAHDIDAPLRLSNNSLARTLCEAVLRLEREMSADQPKPQTLADEAEAIALQLQAAQDSFDFATPEPIAGGGPCVNPVGAVTHQSLTTSRIEEAAATLRQVADLAESGETQGAAQAFSGDAHNITHDIDGPLRVADQQTALDLCETIVALESEFAGAQDEAVIAANARKVADLLEAAALALGYAQ
jgi:hypothetical protein